MIESLTETTKKDMLEAIEGGHDDELDLLCITWLKLNCDGSHGVVANKLLDIIEDLTCD